MHGRTDHNTPKTKQIRLVKGTMALYNKPASNSNKDKSQHPFLLSNNLKQNTTNLVACQCQRAL
jgi:hypothetical protein